MRARLSAAAGVEGEVVWIACDCGAASRFEWTRMTEPPPSELDVRGRRLRAALAAVLVRDKAPGLRLVRRSLDSWSGIGLIIAA
jgi:hypothetical protein